MLYDGLLAIDLPVEESATADAPFWEGLERLLFDGHWRRRPRKVVLSTGVVLARCYAALKPLSTGPIRLSDDAKDLFSIQIVPETYGEQPPPWPELLPPAWTREPAAFRMFVVMENLDFVATLNLRYTPEPWDHQPPLSGALRLAWRPKMQDNLLQRLSATFLPGHALRELKEILQFEGAGLGAEILKRFGWEGDTRGDVRVLSEPEDPRYEEILRGFGEAEKAVFSMVTLKSRTGGYWPALSPDGVKGEIQRGQFVAGAQTEVALAM